MMKKILIGTCAALAIILTGCTATGVSTDKSSSQNQAEDSSADSADTDSTADDSTGTDAVQEDSTKTDVADSQAEAADTETYAEDSEAEVAEAADTEAEAADTETEAADTEAEDDAALEEDAGTLAEQAANPGALIRINGKKYKYNTNLKNYLFLGIDTWEPFEDSYEVGDAGQADSIYIVSVDKSTGEGKILTIHRNTMTDVNHYDSNGQITETDSEQICMQYAYTTGNDASCRAMEDTVSTLLFNLPIDGYVTLSGGGITSLTDVLGGVDVTITGDYTALDASFVKGSTLHMDGETALAYVHYRDTKEYDSATDRMNRQLDFISGVLKNISSRDASDLYSIFEEFDGDYILTSLNAEEIKGLTNYTYDVDNSLSIPGTMQPAEPYEEYIVDENALQDLVLQNFYVEQE